MDNQTLNQDTSIDEVGMSGIAHIKITFDALINQDVFENNRDSTNWYKSLGIDKSDASKYRRGLMIPSHDLRLKISAYFKTDSTSIWKIQDMDEIRNLLLNQKRKNGNNN